MKHQARQWSARRKDGRPCRAWARRDGDQALCVRHIRKAKPGLIARQNRTKQLPVHPPTSEEAI